MKYEIGAQLGLAIRERARSPGTVNNSLHGTQ